MKGKVELNKFAVFIASILLLGYFAVSSFSGSGPKNDIRKIQNPSSIEAAIEEIKKEQGVDNVFLINPDKVSDRLLEKTGEALIKNMPPNPREHEIFDGFIIGKKGLSSLNVVHRFMGYHYLKGDFYGGPGNLYGPDLVCGPVVSKPRRGNSFIMFSARYLALLWFLLIVMALTNVYLLLKIRTKVK